MPRRHRGGVIDADRGDDIEILDLDAFLTDDGVEVVESEPAGSLSPLGVAAGLIVAAVAMFGVITTGNTPAPQAPEPLVTVPPEPLSPEEAALAAEVAELEATYGVEIGDGPDLNWQQVVWNIDADRFQWVGDGFVGDDGETETTIRPNMVGPTVSQRESLSLDFPGYRVQAVDGGRLLIPEDGDTAHLLAVVDDREPVRFELPLPAVAPSTDLVKPSRMWFDAQVIDDQLVVIGFQFLEIDFDALGARTGRDLTGFDFVVIGRDRIIPRVIPETGVDPDLELELILFDDVGFTEAELADLQLLDNDPGQSEAFTMDLARATVEPLPLPDLLWAESVERTASGVAVVWNDQDEAQAWLSTSTDGTVWSTRPMSSIDSTVWFSGSRIYTFPIGGPSSIRRSGDLGRVWQRTRRPFASSEHSVAVNDVLIVVERAPENGDASDIAITRWDPAADDPEWRIEPIDTVFPGALRVDFAIGDNHILATVTTSRGTDFYLADTTA